MMPVCADAQKCQTLTEGVIGVTGVIGVIKVLNSVGVIFIHYYNKYIYLF